MRGQESGDTLLHKGARCGDVPIIQLALEHSNNRSELLNAGNELGQTPLLLACIAGELSAALALLDAGANANKPDHKGDIPLHWLHVFESKSIPALASALLEHGADVNAETKRVELEPFYQKTLCAGTPLHRAAAWNSYDAVKFLLEHGADPLRPGVWHELGTPLWLACTFHNNDVVEIMLEHIGKTKDVEAIINDHGRGEWPLIKPALDIGYYYLNGAALGRMVRHGNGYRYAAELTLKVLKQNGATMVLTEVPALSQAVMLRCIDIVQVLLDLCPEMINIPGGRQRQPPLHFAVEQDRPDLVELLLSRDVDLKGRRGDGLTALAHYANHFRGLEIPSILLEKGLTFELPSPGLQTPFFGAIKNEAFELARCILENTPNEARHLMINSPCYVGTNFSCAAPGMTILGYLLHDCSVNTPHTLRKFFDLVSEFNEHVEFMAYPGEDMSALQCLGSFHRHMRLNPVLTALAKELLKRYNSAKEINYARKIDGKTALWLGVRQLNYDLVGELLSNGADTRIADSEGVSALDLLQKQIVHVRTVEHHEGKEEQRLVEEMQRLFRNYGYSVESEGGEINVPK